MTILVTFLDGTKETITHAFDPNFNPHFVLIRRDPAELRDGEARLIICPLAALRSLTVLQSDDTDEAMRTMPNRIASS